MEFIKGIGHRFVYATIGVFLALSLVAAGITASAAQVSERSVQLSNSSKSMEDVTYTVKFTPINDAAAIVLDFCSDTPVIGQDCAVPADFSLAGVASAPQGYTLGTSTPTPIPNRLILNGDVVAANGEVEFDVEGVDNPSAVGAMYVRISTFNSVPNAQSATFTTGLNHSVDQGSLAVSITDTIGVSGRVLESLTFCASGAAIEGDCEDIVDPVLVLGQEQGEGGPVALEPNVLSQGNIHIKLSTNASKGAIVRLQSNAFGCGGLLRAGDTEACDIKPALVDGEGAGDINAESDAEAKFGLKLTEATAESAAAPGVLVPYTGSVYNTNRFAMNFNPADNEAAGVTSTFGDPILHTDGKLAVNKAMQLIFGVSAKNDTPAGLYSADISLIATGTF